MKQPILVEVYGEPECGKTHFCFSGAELGYNPFLIDTTPKAEGQAIAIKFFGDKYNEHYARARTLSDVRKYVDFALNNGYNIISIDTSANLQDMAIEEWKKEKGRDRPLPFEYGDIRDKVDNAVIYRVIPESTKEPYKAHLIFTSQTAWR
jgi:hypothetical protein